MASPTNDAEEVRLYCHSATVGNALPSLDPLPGALVGVNLNMREVVAEVKKLVRLHPIGKNSDVTLHLAKKAFYQDHHPFPLLHIDTTRKFKGMIAFRDHFARKFGPGLMVYSNEYGLRRGSTRSARLVFTHPRDEGQGVEAGSQPENGRIFPKRP